MLWLGYWNVALKLSGVGSVVPSAVILRDGETLESKSLVGSNEVFKVTVLSRNWYSSNGIMVGS